MPKPIDFANIKTTFFAHKLIVAGSIWAGATFILLIPTCLMLAPKGKAKAGAEEERDEAQAAWTNTNTQLSSTVASLNEAKQRIIDIDCAIMGYPGYNLMVIDFSNQIGMSNFSATDRLKTFWNLSFANDKTENKVTTADKTYRTHRRVGMVTTGRTHHYQEVTTITQTFKNILTGPGLNLNLNCGYSSQAIQATASTYRLSATSPVTSGDRSSGRVDIKSQEQYRSLIQTTFRLGDTKTISNLLVSVDKDQSEAAENLEPQLFKFLAASIALFNTTTVASLQAAQNQLNNSLPGLFDKAQALNHTLQQETATLAAKQASLDSAGGEFRNSLSLWLPLLFLVPAALALFSYLTLYGVQQHASEKEEAEPGREMTTP